MNVYLEGRHHKTFRRTYRLICLNRLRE